MLNNENSASAEDFDLSSPIVQNLLSDNGLVLTINQNQIKNTIEIPILNDGIPEPEEIFEIEISAVSPIQRALLGWIRKAKITIKGMAIRFFFSQRYSCSSLF